MLVLTRRADETIVLCHCGVEMRVHVLQTAASRVVLGLSAPAEVSIRREELDPLPFAAPARRSRPRRAAGF